MVAEDELLTVPEIALRLKVREETVREWLRKSEIQGYNFGGRTGWRIPASEVDLLLTARAGKRSPGRVPEEPIVGPSQPDILPGRRALRKQP